MKATIPDLEREVLECFDDPRFKIGNGHIVTLDLSCNYYLMTSLPENIGNLTSLKNLDISLNQLASLPESIGNLIMLEILNLEMNRLTSLPKSIGNLISLKYLRLDQNKLKNLPESIGNLTSLKNLDLSKNQLEVLPDSIENLISLEDLDLSRNQLSSLPESIKNLKNIKYLDLQDNPFKTLSNFSIDYLINSRLDPNFLTIKGRRLYQRSNFIELLEYYRKTPENLATEYAQDRNSLTEDEMERLIHEMGRKAEKILEGQLPIDDPLLKKLVEKDSLELSSGFKIYL